MQAHNSSVYIHYSKLREFDAIYFFNNTTPSNESVYLQDIKMELSKRELEILSEKVSSKMSLK